MSNTMLNPVQKKMEAPVMEAVFDLLRKTKGQRYVSITGRSMLPIIREGDQALVSLGCAGIRRGDVIVFRHEGVLIAHRVLRIGRMDPGYRLVTKGDNVPYFDAPLRDNQVVGRVLAVKRGNRQVPLDTVAWRMAGWLIAIGALSFDKLQVRVRNLRQKYFGLHFRRETSFVYRGVQVLSRAMRKSLMLFFSR
ncbi:MAG: signal peptidase I [Candidatus Brocadia sp.]|nr:signal peptidase I [Candidatus Brocadia sp.]